MVKTILRYWTSPINIQIVLLFLFFKMVYDLNYKPEILELQKGIVSIVLFHTRNSLV